MNYRVKMWNPDTVRKFREDKGLTQIEFAEKIGFSQAAVSRAETDVHRISVDYIVAMNEAFTEPIGFFEGIWLKVRWLLGLYDKTDVTPVTFEAFVEMYR